MQPNRAVGFTRLFMCGQNLCFKPPVTNGLFFTAMPPSVITAGRYSENPAKYTNRIVESHLPHGLVPHSDSLAKYAAAFFKISHSIRNCATSLRNLLNSASWAETSPRRPAGHAPLRDRLTQLANVFGDTDSRRAVSAIPRPSDSAIATAWVLNSLVYRPLGIFPIVIIPPGLHYDLWRPFFTAYLTKPYHGRRPNAL